MPEGYEKMRDSFMKDGLSKKDAQEKAAKIWNSKNPDNPVGRSKKHEEPKTMIGGIDDANSKILETD
jgi:hypothetical protein